MPSTINLDNGAQVANISLDSAGNLDFNFNNSNDTRVSINDDNGIVTIGGGQGGVGRNGGLQIRNSVGAFTIFLGDDGGTSNIFVGGATNSAIRIGNAQGLTTIAMEGATGNMNLGAGPQGSVPGQDGNLVLLDGRGGASIVLAGSW